MCTPGVCDLEEIPLEEDDTNSIEFQILEHYAKHHVFKIMAAVSSPKLLRTRSLSQKVLGSWSSNESWTQVSWPCRTSRSSEKPINLAKKKSSWRTLFGGAETEAGSQSSTTETQAKNRRQAECRGGRRAQPRAGSSSNVEEFIEVEGRLGGDSFLPCNQIFPLFVCMAVHLLPTGNGALGRASLCLSFPSY